MGVCHGDVYAHNIMLEGDAAGILCDFGAAFCYDRAGAAAGFWEAMEVRAFGLFMQGLLKQIDNSKLQEDCLTKAAALQGQLQALTDKCLADVAAERPTFAELLKQLQGLSA